MSFANPYALLALLPLGGILVALYLLKMKRRDMVVPASFLWPSRTDEVRANSLFQKLKPNWLLALQLLAITALVGGLAQPQCLDRGLAGKVTVIVLDGSASMLRRDKSGSPSRFDTALNVASEIISSARAGDRVALIWAGPIPRVVFPLTSEPSRRRAALRDLRAVESPGDMGQALRLAAAVAAGGRGAQILILSDGVFPPVQDFSPGEASLRLQRVGSPAPNLAVDVFGVNPDTGRALLGLKAYGGRPGATSVSLYADGSLIDSAQVSLDARGTWTRTFSPPRKARVLEAKVEVDDALRADNYAAISASPQGEVRVLLVGEESLFLERALSLEPRVILDKTPVLPEGEEAGSPGKASYDVVIFNGVPGREVKAKGALIFGPSSPIASGVAVNRPTWEEDEPHPLLKEVSLDDVYVEKGWSLTPRGSGKIISRSSKGPWVAASTQGPRTIHVGFQLEESDFPLKFSFPIFLYQAIDWVAGGDADGVLVVSPGKSFSLPTRGEPAELAGPGGWRGSALPQGGRAIAAGLPSSGIYKATWAKAATTVYSSFRDQRESDSDPQDSPVLGGSPVQSQSVITRLSDLWRHLLLAALAILAIEWWLYARRS